MHVHIERRQSFSLLYRYLRQSLRKNILNPITIDLNPYEKLNSYQKCVDLLLKINDVIRANNDNLEKKIDNPYEPIITKSTSIKELIIQIIDAVASLEKERLEYNNVAKRTKPMIAELDRINGEIAYYDVKDLAQQLAKQQTEVVTVKRELDRLKREYDGKKKEIEDLEAQRSNVQIAIDAINAIDGITSAKYIKLNV